MKNANVKQHARTLLHLVTAGSIYEHFSEQQQHLLERGRITRKVPQKKLRVFADECHKSLKHQVRMVATPRDLQVLERALVKELAPNKAGFLKAVWKGNRVTTMRSLHESYDD